MVSVVWEVGLFVDETVVSQSGRLTTQSGVKMFQLEQSERLLFLMSSQSETCL